MMKCAGAALSPVLLAAALSLLLGAAPAAAQAWTAETVADGLDYPWDIARSGETLIITEKAGFIVMVADGAVRRIPLQTREPIRSENGAGLLGLALAPDFAESGRAFFYHSTTSPTGPANRIIAAHFDGARWAETGVLLDAIPGHPLYNGGRIAIGPDGHLYATTGWTEDYDLPQDRESLAGKILRMTPEGAVPPDNPFPGSLVYSYGHRNPQGLAWDAAGAFHVAEHGQSGHDEINRVRAGANYGWPLVSGDETRAGMEKPLVHSGRSTWAPSGATFAGGSLLVASLRERALLALNTAGDGVETVYAGGDRIRQVIAAGETLYLITTNRSPRAAGPSADRLIRLTPRP
ncbi:PQQ-dependent sugar dehydrogenase [Acuticoccus kandeliae]|uniref:PQQ-dependent sugar dehydrogenase n=1 Tax=Acuticoccus kandeliae TaxID=2073160 RepID=UPI000D3ED9D4|nr:PQQ-dependent sugar dehydrogenase [Acuticoccus kandeliae]